MAKRYRMTAKRRAALKKAQLASARKRRGSRFSGLKSAARTTGVVAGSIGATFLSYHANEYIVRPDKFVRHTRVAARNTRGWAGSAAGKIRRRAPRPKNSSVTKDWSKFGYL